MFAWKGRKRVHDRMWTRVGDKYTNMYINLENVYWSKEMSREQEK